MILGDRVELLVAGRLMRKIMRSVQFTLRRVNRFAQRSMKAAGKIIAAVGFLAT